MLFNSLEYAVFLPAVLLAYWALRHRAQNGLLLAASYLFYGWWDARFLTLLAVSTVVDYSVARAMERAEGGRRRALLAVSVAANLGILGFFKYYGFFAESAADLLASLGLGADVPTLRVILPVGISFYTFQTMSYSIDVFRGRIPACRDPLAFAVYVSYFPQLVAGPIERARHLLPQFTNPRTSPNSTAAGYAVLMIVRGLFKKVAIADTLAPLVDRVFTGSADAGAISLVVGILAFGIQIYGDFSGYTDVARGSSRLLGIELMENFSQPYLSRSITEFWRRWHISLSQWLRDYLYVPLGGNRRGPRRTYINLMLTMLLGGLWHGAAWTFVVWGALHGAFLAMHKWWNPAAGAETGRPWRRLDLPATLVTFGLVHLAWVFFRADGIGQALEVLGGVATLRPGEVLAGDVVLLMLAAGAMLAIDASERFGFRVPSTVTSPTLAGAAYGVMLLGLVVASGHEAAPFIYFQF